MRPASKKRQCFYCHNPIGAVHKADCVAVQKKVTIELTVRYEISVPNHWSKEDVEFNRNDGTRCADNNIEELTALCNSEDKAGRCLCRLSKVKYIGDVPRIPFLDE